MTHEKIIKRPDGTRYRFYAFITGLHFGQDPKFVVEVEKCDPRKRTFKKLVDTNHSSYRRLNHEERKAFFVSEFLKHVTEEEMLAVKLELWEKLKPT